MPFTWLTVNSSTTITDAQHDEMRTNTNTVLSSVQVTRKLRASESTYNNPSYVWTTSTPPGSDISTEETQELRDHLDVVKTANWCRMHLSNHHDTYLAHKDAGYDSTLYVTYHPAERTSEYATQYSGLLDDDHSDHYGTYNSGIHPNVRSSFESGYDSGRLVDYMTGVCGTHEPLKDTSDHAGEDSSYYPGHKQTLQNSHKNGYNNIVYGGQA